MVAVLNTGVLLLVLYAILRARGIENFLLVAAVVTIPLKTDYMITHFTAAYQGWTSGLFLSASDALFIAFAFKALIGTKRFHLLSGADLWPAILLLVSSALSLVNSTWMKATVFQVLLVGKCLLLCYMIPSKAINDEGVVNAILISFAFSLMLQGLLGVAQFLSGSALDFFSTGSSGAEFMEIGQSGFRRVFGTNIGKPNMFGAYLSSLLLIMIPIAVTTRSHRRLFAISCGLGLLALVLSQSRGAWLGFAIAMFLMVVILVKDEKIRPNQLCLAVVLLLVLLACFYPVIGARLSSDEVNDAAVQSRLPLNQVALKMAERHPVFGIGANTFRSVIHFYASGIYIRYFNVVHNQYLLMLSETGAIGLISWILLLTHVIRNALIVYRRSLVSSLRYLGLGICLSVIAMSIHMMVDMFNSQLTLSNLMFIEALSTGLRVQQVRNLAAQPIGSSGSSSRELSASHDLA